MTERQDQRAADAAWRAQVEARLTALEGTTTTAEAAEPRSEAYEEIRAVLLPIAKAGGDEPVVSLSRRECLVLLLVAADSLDMDDPLMCKLANAAAKPIGQMA